MVFLFAFGAMLGVVFAGVLLVYLIPLIER